MCAHFPPPDKSIPLSTFRSRMTGRYGSFLHFGFAINRCRQSNSPSHTHTYTPGSNGQWLISSIPGKTRIYISSRLRIMLLPLGGHIDRKDAISGRRNNLNVFPRRVPAQRSAPSSGACTHVYDDLLANNPPSPCSAAWLGGHGRPLS